jgi:hypothetical protein
MRKCLLAVAAAVIPWFGFAQTAIDGVWKTDPKSVVGASKPSQYVVKDGTYRCESCAPKIRVKADGSPHPVPGNPYLDTVSARVIDEFTFEVVSKKDKLVTTGTMTVSADRRSMVREITAIEANGTTSHSTETLARVGAPPPKGAHAVSGSWRFAALVKMSDETLTFKTAAGTLSMNGSDGSSYDAPMDGTKVPMRNAPGTDEVSVTTRGGNTWEETSYSGGKATWVNLMVLSADGEKLRINWEDKMRGSKGSFTMLRQWQ